jgi:hypothetical protein
LVKSIGKEPVRVRSGSCGGLDARLPGSVYVNIPVNERFVDDSPLQLRVASGALVVSAPYLPEVVPIDLVLSPEFQRHDGDERARRTGQVCFDRLGIGLTNFCTFWKGSDRRCKFCSIGLNIGTEDRDKALDAIRHVVQLALADPINPARHILLGGGTPSAPDAGAATFAAAARVIRQVSSNVSIYAMMAAPDDPEALVDLFAAGINELGINLELFDERAASYYLPAKFERHSRAHVLATLERAVEIFGPLNTRSILVVGLEPVESTTAGARALAERGVMPILSPLRPLVGTPIQDRRPPTPAVMAEVADAAGAAAAAYDVPLGPTCLACQGNTINPAWDASYQLY